MYRSFTDIKDALSVGRINCVELVNHYLEEIEKQQHLNAFLEVYKEDALAAASTIDEKIKKGNAGSLAGMVLGLKDVLCYNGHHVSSSSKILEGFESVFTATAVQRLIDEDVIIIGRLNCDEFAMGASNENSAFGNVLNAADNSRVPGGSSGGSAVAVQAGLCTASLGTDTGGSVRQPASFCGIYGLKPTYGRISRYGLLAYASSFDQIGIFTNNIEDSASMLEVMSGQDEFDATSSSVEVANYKENLNVDKKLNIAWLGDALELDGIDPEIKESCKQLSAKLDSLGHKNESVSFPYLDYMVPAYYVLTTAEASSNLARYDGVHFGYRSDKAVDLETTYTLSRTEGFGAEVKRRIMSGTFVLSAGYYDAYYAKAQKVRRIIRDKTNEILDKHDFILLPTTPTPAFKIGEKADDPISMYLADIFTVQAALAGLPAISIPMWISNNGLPYGLQIVGRKFDEQGILALSKYLMDQFAPSSNN